MKEVSKNNTLLEIVEFLLHENEEGLNVHELFKQSAQIKGIDLGDVDVLAQLYLDMTMSAKFVYLGDEIWDLKDRNLEFWDKENFGYVETDYEDEEEDDLDFSDFVLEEDMLARSNEGYDEDEKVDVAPEEEEEKAYIDMELPIKSTDEDDGDEPEIEFDDDDDEEQYNELMDDYEDMYD